jgi:carbon-monoxide dehydrogenase medium subunit
VTNRHAIYKGGVMPKKPGAYYRPDNLDEALQYLSKPDTAPLAGGTELLAQEDGVSLTAIVDLQDLGLDQISLEDNRLRIEAMVTLDELDRFLTKEMGTDATTPLLQKAIHQAGPNTYRNSATLGGVCASRLSDSELLAALLVLETDLVYRVPAISMISLGEYLQSDGQLQGLITEILIPWKDGQGASARVARTPKDYPIVSITTWQPAAGTTRLAATGLGTRPFRLATAESELLEGQDETSVAAAANAARDATLHPGDFRGDAGYRAEMAAVLTRRVLSEL